MAKKCCKTPKGAKAQASGVKKKMTVPVKKISKKC